MTGVNVALILEVHEEEQLVLHDGATHAHAGGVVERLGELQTVGIVAKLVLFAELGADETVVGEVVIHAHVPAVGTALGDGVDGTTREAAMAHVEWRDVDGHGLDSIQGDGATTGRQVAADTESVVERSTVNRDV